MGKGIRSPARDTIISYAGKSIGRGWGFAIHEALDQVGAVIGPIILSLALSISGSYREGFTILWIPTLLALVALIIANRKAPLPQRLETRTEAGKQNVKARLSRIFWLYAVFTFFSGAGLANFQLISYHIKTRAIVPDAQIPILYAIAMGVDAIIALVIGKAYDKLGLITLAAIPVLTLPIPFIGFSNTFSLILFCVILWGSVMGIHETIMRAAIADLVSVERRGVAYGIFNTVYGTSLFIGSAIMGFLYDFSINYLLAFVVMMELLAVPALLLVKKSS